MSLYTWGKNTCGQLGSEPTRVQLPVAPPDDDDVQADTELKLPKRFNRQSQGQKPARVRIGGESFVGAAAGEHHTLAVTKYGDVYSCGRDKEGQLGHGEASSLFESTPRKVKALKHVTVALVACGANHSVVVSSTGRLYEWGFVHTQPDAPAQGSSDAQLLALAGPSRASGTANSRLSNVVADSARRWLAATDRDGVDEATSEEDEEMDAERALMHRRMLDNLPQRGREAIPRLARSLLGVRVITVSAGYAHTVAVSADGRAYSSGQNDRGQLGLGHRIHSGIFREVMGMQGCFVLEVACGEQHNLARVLPGRSSGPSENSQAAALFVWGGGRLGQLGLGSDSTRLAATRNSYMDDVGGGVIGVGAGANHSVCVVANGRVYGWGHAEYNQQGVEVIAGADLMRDHDGYSYFRVPRMIRGLADADVVSACCGSNFTLAVDKRGVTYSFGWNEGDTLGRGWAGASDPSPGPVLSLPPIVAIAAGSRHAVVVAAEGSGCGRHLSSLPADADSADVELTVPDDARRGIPVHMAVVSVRCPYLAGHVQAALKGGEDGVSRQRQDEGEGMGEGTSSLPAAEVCLEHATVETLSLLVRYLYTDELVGDVSGKDLKGLIDLANEMRLPRLESLCVTRLPYYLRRQYRSRNSQAQSSDGTNGSNLDVPSTLVSEMGALAGSPRYSDVSLVLPEWGWKFHCHKAILCSAPWWRALLLGGFREGGRDTMDMTGLLQEGITRSEALEAAVRHVYTHSDDTVVNMDPSSVMEVVILAEYMVLPSLLQACELELKRYVDAESAPFLSSFANKYHLFKLETLCEEILDGSDDGKRAQRDKDGTRSEQST